MIEMCYNRKYTIVTVVFEDDVELLNLQAKSLDIYADASLIEEIIVIDNFNHTPKNWSKKLFEYYGRLASKVRIIQSWDIIENYNYSGWYYQQVLKLAISKFVNTDRYVVLDAKNHLIKPLTREFLETSNGKTKINGYGYKNHSSSTIKSRLFTTCKFIGIDHEKAQEKFVRTSTPFTMITSVSKNIVENVGGIESNGFIKAFMDNELTEFFLYAATLVHCGVFDELYDWEQLNTPSFWNWVTEDIEIVKKIIEETKDEKSGPFISIHRGAIVNFTPAMRSLIAQLWVERSLFSNIEDGIEFLSNIGKEI